MDEMPTQPEAAAELPHRDVRDPKTLRALAHPLRMKLFDALAEHGSATATRLAEIVGDTQANCSWHLRQLHKHGFIEEEPDTKGRQRPWRLVRQSLNVDLGAAGQGGAAGAAATALSDVFVEQDVDALRSWKTVRADEPEAWRSAATENRTWAWMTVEEFDAFTTELGDVMRRHIMNRLDRVDEANRPAGSRPIRYVNWAIPVGQHPADEPEES